MEKKDLILDSMLELLAEKKGESCSVSEIAKSGNSKGGMYYYFKSKEEVFDAFSRTDLSKYH